jgi:hypothetical protein
MNPKMKLTLLACALGAASIAPAQTTSERSQTNIPPPSDIIRLPGSVTTPDMPVVVSAPREDIGRGTSGTPANGTSRQSLPVIRNLGSGSSMSGSATRSTAGGAGSAAGNGTATSSTTGRPAARSVNGSTSSAGTGGPTDIGGVNGARSSAGLDGGITTSSGGKSGVFDSGSKPSDNSGKGAGAGTGATAGAATAGADGSAASGDNSTIGDTSNTAANQNNPSGSSGTVPAGRAGGPASNGAAGGRGASSGGK